MKTSRDLEQELEESEVFGIVQKIWQLKYSAKILDGNYDELINHIEAFSKRETIQKLRFFERKLPVKLYEEDVKRLLHNYLASAQSLIDHTRVHYRDLHEKNLKTFNYRSEIETQFSKDPLSLFVKDFRNYLQHFKTPDISISFDIVDVEIKNPTIQIPKKILLEYSGWKALSRKFLESHNGDVDIKEIIQIYQSKVTSFYKWFYTEQSIVFAEEFKIYNSIKEEIKKSQITEFITRIENPDYYITEYLFEFEMMQIFEDDELDIFIDLEKKQKINTILSLLKAKNNLKLKSKLLEIYSQNTA